MNVLEKDLLLATRLEGKISEGLEKAHKAMQEGDLIKQNFYLKESRLANLELQMMYKRREKRSRLEKVVQELQERGIKIGFAKRVI